MSSDADVLSAAEVAFQKLRRDRRRWPQWAWQKTEEATLRILGPEKFAQWQRQVEEARR